MLSTEHVRLAYRKLKQLVYYDKTDLCLRLRLAEFECDPDFEKRLLVVQKLVNSENSISNTLFNKWLKEINFRIIPKKLDNNRSSTAGSETEDGKFLSNVTSEKIFNVTKVNYFFDGPIELHLIAVLWIMAEGRFLDIQLGDECYGSRLDKGVGEADDKSPRLFRKYHELYARWRDSGIQKAKQLLTEEQKNVCILGLDVLEYYYNIRLDSSAIARAIHKESLESSDAKASLVELGSSPSSLLKCLEAICSSYRKKIEPFLKITHKHLLDFNIGIPIGLCSSPLLADWYLKNFDEAVKTHVRPAYYGRYVDDILMVIPVSEDLSKMEHPIMAFMDRILVQTGLLDKPKRGCYEIVKPGGLFLQQSKCILQYFDAKHSIAGLEKFQKKLEENSSNFLLLPVDEADNSLEEVAYELLYEGSVNKFRSVAGVTENRYELAKHLAKQTMLHLLTDDPPDPKVSLGLRKFFKGKNAIEFHDLWERVFTFFLAANDIKAQIAFAKQLKIELNRVRFSDNQMITKYLVTNLMFHLELSQAMAAALSEPNPQNAANNQRSASVMFRKANLIRHQFVRLPLLNYTNYPGSLLTRKVETAVKQDPIMIENSPRYVNFDECLLLSRSGDVKLDKISAFQWATEMYEALNGCKTDGMDWNFVQLEKDAPNDSL
jgi:hypothetical protein